MSTQQIIALRSILPLGTPTQWGKIAGVHNLGGERFYWIVLEDNNVGMMPACMVEPDARQIAFAKRSVADPTYLELAEDVTCEKLLDALEEYDRRVTLSRTDRFEME